MKKFILDPKNTLTNVGNSILGFFDVPKFHDSFEPLDKILKETNKQKVALILLDGMGKIIFETYKDDIPYLYSHILTEYKSVFPPTTVAATTTLTTGKYPIETCYLGWTQYFASRKAFINVFPSNNPFNHKEFFTPNVTSTELATTYIWDLINKTLKHNAANISSFFKKTPEKEDDFEAFFKDADKLIKEHDFVYVYSTNPDHLLHVNGIKNETVRENVIYLEKKVKELVENNKDTLFILTADHGFADIEEINFKLHQDFLDTLNEDVFSIEPRFATVSVKDEAKFLELANKYYGDYFYIKTKKELLEEHTFGYGVPIELFDSTTKDYFLIAKDKYCFYQSDEPIGFKGTHAGCLDSETEIYLLVFNA